MIKVRAKFQILARVNPSADVVHTVTRSFEDVIVVHSKFVWEPVCRRSRYGGTSQKPIRITVPYTDQTLGGARFESQETV
jgi:hypothetical protein